VFREVKYALFWNGFERSKLRKLNLLFKDTDEGGCSAEVLRLVWTGEWDCQPTDYGIDNVDSVTFQEELTENQA
jgi:hypothetical protein